MKHGYVIEFHQPYNPVLPLWPEKSYTFTTRKSDINAEIKRWRRYDTFRIIIYKATMEIMEYELYAQMR